jgi:kynurenine formamidase
LRAYTRWCAPDTSGWDRQPHVPRDRHTAYLKNGGTLENSAALANHASTHTTQLYDRRRDDISLDEVDRIRV